MNGCWMPLSSESRSKSSLRSDLGTWWERVALQDVLAERERIGSGGGSGDDDDDDGGGDVVVDEWCLPASTC